VKRSTPATIAICLLVVIGTAIASFAVGHKTRNCNEEYRTDIDLTISGRTVHTQTALTNLQRQRGLSGRECIGSDQAMLFIFDKPGYYPFWMKDMKFPIDMVWLSAAKQVVTVVQAVSPSSYPESFVSSQPAKYVIELASGQSQKLGFITGAQVSF